MVADRNQSELVEAVPAQWFAVNGMFCPGCHRAVAEAVAQCPACGYSGGKAVDKFPFAAPEWQGVIDPDGHLGDGERREIEEATDRLRESFPQPRFCFCVVGLERETDPREFAFWLMNASPVRDAEEERRRLWSVLFLIDHAHHRVSVTPGYAIEPFLNEESWRSLLQWEVRSFLEGDYGTAIVRCLNGAAAVLSEAALRAQERSGKNGRDSSW